MKQCFDLVMEELGMPGTKYVMFSFEPKHGKVPGGLAQMIVQILIRYCA